MRVAAGSRQLAPDLQRHVLALQRLVRRLQPLPLAPQPLPLTPLRVLRSLRQPALGLLPMRLGVQQLRLDPQRPVHSLERTVIALLPLLGDPAHPALDLQSWQPKRQTQRLEPVGHSPGRLPLPKPERLVREGLARCLGDRAGPPTSL